MSEYIENDENGVSVGLVEKKYFTFAEPPDSMVLESNARLGPITIAYETLGTLNENKSNVILVLHALSGDSHVAGYYGEEDRKPGWWDIMVGPGKGIDTDKYFVICPNIIGSCMGSTGPSSLNPETGEPYGFDFPVVTIGDMVKAQKALLDHLGIEKILTVVGGSIGGMQVLEWAVRYPGIVFSAIPLATTTRHSALAIAFNEVARQAIMADPNWNMGRYYDSDKPNLGLALARQRRVEQALGSYETVLRLNPKHVKALNNIGNLLLESGAGDRAAEYYRTAIQVDPSFLESWYNLGFLLGEVKLLLRFSPLVLGHITIGYSILVNRNHCYIFSKIVRQ